MHFWVGEAKSLLASEQPAVDPAGFDSRWRPFASPTQKCICSSPSSACAPAICSHHRRERGRPRVPFRGDPTDHQSRCLGACVLEILAAAGAQQLEPVQPTPVGRKTRFKHVEGVELWGIIEARARPQAEDTSRDRCGRRDASEGRALGLLGRADCRPG